MGIKYLSLILFSIILVLSTTALANGLEIQGDFKSRLEVNLDEEAEIPDLINMLTLELSHYSSNSGLFKGCFKYNSNSNEVDLKELYIENYFPSTDLIVGKQRIAWGKADGINPTDNFNPEDLRNPFSEDNKLAVTAVRAKYYKEDWIFDIVWAPLFTAAELPEPGSRWSAVPVDIIIEPQEPENSLENSEIGVRASKWSGSIDFSFSYFRGWNKTPAWPGQPIMEKGELVFRPEYYQVDVLGADFARDFGSFVFRGEMAYFKTKEGFQLRNPYFQYVFGVDFNPTNELYINTQLAGEKEEGEEGTKNLMLSLQYDFSEFKSIELNGVYNIDDKDSMINPLFNYEIMDGVAMKLGAYLFSGEEESLFGGFDNNDYGYMEIVKSF